MYIHTHIINFTARAGPFHYANQNPPDDAFSVTSTRKYLEACSKLFENGFLCHKKTCSCDSEVLISIQDGFFYRWINSA